MPVEVRDRAESMDRYWYFLVDAITIALVIALMSRSGVPAPEVGLQLEGWKSNVVIGIAAGIVTVLIESLVARFPSDAISRNATDYLRRGRVSFWVFVFFSGAFAEELWIAFCLVAMRTTGHTVITSIAATALVFGAVHFTYRFGALAVAIKGAASALLFLWCGSLIPMFVFHFTGNLGTLYWLRRAGGQPSRAATG